MLADPTLKIHNCRDYLHISHLFPLMFAPHRKIASRKEGLALTHKRHFQYFDPVDSPNNSFINKNAFLQRKITYSPPQDSAITQIIKVSMQALNSFYFEKF